MINGACRGPWKLSVIRLLIKSHLRKESIPIKKTTSGVKHTHHFLLDGCIWTALTGIERKRETSQVAKKKRMSWLSVDWRIKCVASVNFYLPILLLFYGQSRIMLLSMNECGGEKINGTFPISMWPGLLRWSLIRFWCPVELVYVLGFVMSQTSFHKPPTNLLQTPIFLLTEKNGRKKVLYFWKPFKSSRRN